MPTRSVTLTPAQDDFIEEMLRSGEYSDASETMRDALRALQQRRAEDALKLERLRRAIQVGLDELDRGEYSVVADEDLDAFLNGLAEAPET